MISIRPATLDDSITIFLWRNDPVTIATSRTGKGVEWEGHQVWFAKQLANTKTKCIIGTHVFTSYGVCWLRCGRSGIWETSVNTNPALRGQGLSIPFLSNVLETARKHTAPIVPVFSTEIKDGNVASIKMFERCGFVSVHPSPGFETYCTIERSL